MFSLLSKLSGRENGNNNTVAFVFVAMAKLHSNKTWDTCLYSGKSENLAFCMKCVMHAHREKPQIKIETSHLIHTFQQER